jgi:hypothetical protein
VKVDRPAHDLLLACATWNASGRELDRVSALVNGRVDWDAWFEMVRWHRLVPHAQRLLGAPRAITPPDVAAGLTKETIAIAAGALARARQLAVLLEMMRAADVRALPFKGPALSLAAYGDLGVRDSTDLDIVVLPADLDAARDVLLAAGYVSRAGMSRAQERVLQAGYGHFTYDAPGGGAMVELHWRFAARRYPWSIPAEEVFARAVTIDLAGTPVPSPDPADQLLLQLMHGARHQWERLEWLVAFVQLLKRARHDDALLIERARANGSSRALGLALRLAHDVLDAPLYARFERLAGDGRTAVRAARIVRTLEDGTFTTVQPYRYNADVMDRARDRARYIVLSVFAPTPREWELVRLPGWLVTLYYPIRVVRVLALQPIRAARASLARLRTSLVRR